MEIDFRFFNIYLFNSANNFSSDLFFGGNNLKTETLYLKIDKNLHDEMKKRIESIEREFKFDMSINNYVGSLIRRDVEEKNGKKK